MPARLDEVRQDLMAALAALRGVFSTPQWGGRAWKLPGPGGNRKKPKLVAFVAPAGEGGAVAVSFKLARSRAQEVVKRHKWVSPHSFRTLAPSGWVTAEVSTKRQATALKKLLAESRALHGDAEAPTEAPRTGGADPLARRLDDVMAQARKRGWTPGG